MKMILRDMEFPVREATVSGYILNPEWVSKSVKMKTRDYAGK